MPLSQGHPYNTILLEMMAKQCFYVKNKQTNKNEKPEKQTNKQIRNISYDYTSNAKE